MSIAISVVICTRDRCESLKKTLLSLYQQEGGVAFSVIVVDNNSTDKTKQVVEELMSKFTGHLRYVFEASTGISFTRNKGIREAKGEIIAFTDDDCLIDPKWISSIYGCFQKYHCDAMGGKILAIYPEKTPDWVKDNLDILCGPIVYHDHGDETKLYEKSMREFVGANIAFKRSIFDECGYFRTDLGAGRGVMGEDTEYFKRMIQNGKKIYYCGQAVVHHPLVLSRTRLSYIRKWNIQIAKYRFIDDEGGKIDQNLTYYFGIPRYLIKSIILTALSLPLKIFNRRSFLKAWIQLSQKIGRMAEIRKKYKCE